MPSVLIREDFAEYDTAIGNGHRLVEVATKGIPAEVFKKVAGLPGLDAGSLAVMLDVSVKTIQRHVKEAKRLSPQQSEHLLKIIGLFMLGEEVFGEPDAFRRWMAKPAYGLGEKIPQQLLHTVTGIALVEEELTRIAYGDLA